MTDIIGYSRTVQNEKNELVTKLFMRGTPRYMAGSRFKYTPDYIDFNYDSLVSAIGEAIDKMMESDGSKYITDTKSNLYLTDQDEPTFDELMNEFNSILENLIMNNSEEKFVEYYQPRIVEITDKYLGKGQKVNQCSREQTEALSLIVDDLKLLAK